MQSESAATRRRRRIYHQRSLQGSGGTAEQLIPEVDNEEEEEDEDLQQLDERTSLIRQQGDQLTTEAVVYNGSGSPHPPVNARRLQQRLLHLQHQHSAPATSITDHWAPEDGENYYLDQQAQQKVGVDDWHEPVVVAASRAAGGGEVGLTGEGEGVEEYRRGEEEEAHTQHYSHHYHYNQHRHHTPLAAARRQVYHRALSASSSLPHHSPHSPRTRRLKHTFSYPAQPHQQQQQQLTVAGSSTSSALSACSSGQVAAVVGQQLQQQEEGYSNMTITNRNSSSSTDVSPAHLHHGAATSSSTSSLHSPPPHGAAATAGTAGNTGVAAAATSAPAGSTGTGATLKGGTHVVKKRTRFHQRSVTMMPTNSPMMSSSSGPGVMSDEVGLIDRDDRHGNHLDLAATYHSGMSSSHRSHHASRARQGHMSVGKTSTPSLLFTKVKERIREKVFQSSEWPNAAAMMHEKRQRANDLLEASLNSRTNLNLGQIQMHGNKHRKKLTTMRCKSDSGKYPSSSSVQSTTSHGGDPLLVAPSSSHAASLEARDSLEDKDSPDREVTIRDAFRRRSISEDTYDRQPSIIMKKNGVVCSNEDLEFIMQEQNTIGHSKAYRKQRSPRPLKKHLRTQSLDIARLAAQREANPVGPQGPSGCIYLDPQASMESSSSTMSSLRSIDSASSEVNVRSSNRIESSGRGDSLLHSPGGGNLYPEIVLDDKTKETIMEETNGDRDDGDLGEDDDELDDEGNKKAKPVPEIIFDENGQTWDVYGAEFDPEVLGFAIQRHLEKMMERMMAPMALTDEDTAGNTVGSSCSMDAGDGQVEKTKQDSENNSFWVRLLCLFAGRNDVTKT